MIQTELAVFARAKPSTFPLLCQLVKATTATSMARSIVSFQRKALMCHRFYQNSGSLFPARLGSLKFRFNNKIPQSSASFRQLLKLQKQLSWPHHGQVSLGFEEQQSQTERFIDVQLCSDNVPYLFLHNVFAEVQE